MKTITKDGELLIREMGEGDLTKYLEWMTDPETMRYWDGMTVHFDYESVAEKYHRHIEENVTQCIVELGGEQIGFMQFCTLDAELYEMPEAEWNRVIRPGETVYGIDMFIGDVSCRDRGLGTRMLRLLCAALFTDYHADALMIDPKTHNARAIACYRKAGFEDVCVVPEREEQDGVMHDSLIMLRRREK